LQRFDNGSEKRFYRLSQQKAAMTALTAEIMVIQQNLALGADELGASITAPARRDFGMIFARTACHNRMRVCMTKFELCNFKVILTKSQVKKCDVSFFRKLVYISNMSLIS
jgi:hypothetical protein